MRNFDFREVTNARIASRVRQVLILVLAIVIGMIISVSVNAQNSSFQKNKTRFYKSKFRTQIYQYANACNLLEKKRTHKPKSNVRLTVLSKTKQKPQAEVDATATARVTPKPVAKPVEEKPVVVAQKTEVPSPEKIIAEDKKEDEILAENNLPPTTSANHERVRKMVAEQLKNKKDGEPIELAPLYFTFDQDEFSVVDMEPFLIAVEYALQGKTILIEGHTDNKGNGAYNVQLSVKRVQKIRQLMQDMGVSDDQISVVGYGEEIAQHDNNSNDGRQMNRRVDFKAF